MRWACGCRGKRQVEEGRARQDGVDEVLVDSAASAHRLDMLHPPPPLGEVGPGGARRAVRLHVVRPGPCQLQQHGVQRSDGAHLHATSPREPSPACERSGAHRLDFARPECSGEPSAQGLLWCWLRHTVGRDLIHLTVRVALAATEAPGAAATLRRGCCCYRRGESMSRRCRKRDGYCRNQHDAACRAALSVPLLVGCHKRGDAHCSTMRAFALGNNEPRFREIIPPREMSTIEKISTVRVGFDPNNSPKTFSCTHYQASPREILSPKISRGAHCWAHYWNNEPQCPHC